MDRITIERVNAKTHRAELYDFQHEFFPHDHVLAVEEAGDWWLVYDGDEAIGFAGLAPSHRFSNWGYLCRVGIRPAYQGRGLQCRLIRVRVKRAIWHRWDGVFSDTTEGPASANNLAKCGFKIYEPVEPYTGHPNTIYFKKKLTPC